MKENTKTALILFVTFLLPLHWVTGFAMVVALRYEPLNNNTFFLLCTMFAVIAVMFSAGYNTRLREMRGWHQLVCRLAAIGIFALSAWIHYTL